jgi:hypothetical protein
MAFLGGQLRSKSALEEILRFALVNRATPYREAEKQPSPTTTSLAGAAKEAPPAISVLRPDRSPLRALKALSSKQQPQQHMPPMEQPKRDQQAGTSNQSTIGLELKRQPTNKTAVPRRKVSNGSRGDTGQQSKRIDYLSISRQITQGKNHGA